MKRIIAMLLVITAVLSCCLSLTGCSGSNDSSMGYVTRPDGTRVWYYK